jgi:tetratricopeptide (TPR) repeat protein
MFNSNGFTFSTNVARPDFNTNKHQTTSPSVYKCKTVYGVRSTRTLGRISSVSYFSSAARQVTFKHQQCHEAFTLLEYDSGDSAKLLEQTMTQLNATDPKNEQLCREMLTKVDEEHYKDSRVSNFAVEQDPCKSSLPTTVSIDEFWNPVTGHRMLVRSRAEKLSEPIFNKTSIASIRAAAETLWDRQRIESAAGSSGATSRFTYQRPGNSEAHVQDLFDVDPRVKEIVDDALTTRLYPVLRWAFGDTPIDRKSVVPNQDYNPLSSANLPGGKYRLAVYDSLIIRYDATKAKLHNFTGAGQPLHRDLGLCSVNIALSALEDFEGGGTFFENLLDIDLDHLGGIDNERHDGMSSALGAVIKPGGAGEFVAHPCAERHAGCVTTEGVRDIMVLFITARQIEPTAQTAASTIPIVAPRMERVGRIRNEARAATDVAEKRLFNAMAVKEAPHDGDAWSNLGASLLLDSENLAEDQARQLIYLALQCIRRATALLPYDSRIRNNLGLSFSRIKEMQVDDAIDTESAELVKQTELAFFAATKLDTLCDRAGCDVGPDLAVSLLNLGLLYANRDDFARAVQVLSQIKEPVSAGLIDPKRLVVFENGFRLLRFCQSQLVDFE